VTQPESSMPGPVQAVEGPAAVQQLPLVVAPLATVAGSKLRQPPFRGTSRSIPGHRPGLEEDDRPPCRSSIWWRIYFRPIMAAKGARRYAAALLHPTTVGAAVSDHHWRMDSD